jgi:hypothetical protein
MKTTSNDNICNDVVLQDTGGYGINMTNPLPHTFHFSGNGVEFLKISEEGIYVYGEKVKTPEDYEKIFEGMRAFLSHHGGWVE